MATRARFPKTAAHQALKRLGVDPFAELVKLAETTQNEVVMMRIWMELLQYIAPRLRAIEVNEKTTHRLPNDAVISAKQEVFGFE